MKKEDKVNTILKAVHYAIIAVTFVGFLIVWSGLPSKVPVHFGTTLEADSYGSKTILLFTEILSILALIPFSTDSPERHFVDDEELYEFMVQDAYRTSTIKTVIKTAILCGIQWAIVILVLNSI